MAGAKIPCVSDHVDRIRKIRNARILTVNAYCRAVRYEVADAFGYALELSLLELPAHHGIGVQAVCRIVREKFSRCQRRR